MNQKFRQRNRLLLVAYLIITAACLLPAFGLAFNNSALVLGVPLSVLWLTVCFTLLAVVTALAYKFVFRLWSEVEDATLEDEAHGEDVRQ